MGKPTFEAAALDDILARHFPQHSSLRQLEEGEESRTFAFDCPEGAFVLRANADARGFHKDRLAFELLNSERIPVPEVLVLEDLGDGTHVCVSRRLAGVTLQALPAGGAYGYGPALAGLLNALANVDAEKLDRLANETDGGTWPDFVTAIADYDWSHCPGEHAGLIERMIGSVLRRAARLSQDRGVVHGDFGSNNVLVEDGRVTGLIDWSEARTGAPLYDLANILFWRSWLDCMEQQARYFEAEEPRWLADRDSLVCYQLRIGLETLHGAFASGDQHLAGWALETSRAILAAG